MIGWFGDANGYVGNLDLKPEVAHTVSFTAAWRDPGQGLGSEGQPYFSYVENFIDADRIGGFTDRQRRLVPDPAIPQSQGGALRLRPLRPRQDLRGAG